MGHGTVRTWLEQIQTRTPRSSSERKTSRRTRNRRKARRLLLEALESRNLLAADVVGRAPSGDWWVAKSTGVSFVNQLWGFWSPIPSGISWWVSRWR